RRSRSWSADLRGAGTRPVPAGVTKPGGQPFAAALSLEPTVTFGTLVAGMFTGSPVCGFRPVRAARCARSKVRYPGIVSFSPPLATTCVTSSKKAVSTRSTSAWDIEVRSAMAFTRSARVIVVLPSQKRVGGHRTDTPGSKGGWSASRPPRILVLSSTPSRGSRMLVRFGPYRGRIDPDFDGVAPDCDGVAPDCDGVAPDCDGVAPDFDIWHSGRAASRTHASASA